MESLGRYQIIEQIGAGAMGAVYKARDPMMNREVAIKTILTHAIEGPESAEFRERFYREAQAAGRLAHPGIVTVYDVAEHEGAPYLVMEYVAGRTLLSILQNNERMDANSAIELGIQLADALGYAHRNGVIHRDIKPANILITTDGRAKIADFGIARLAESQFTSTGQLLGTPAFMAPEQFVGAPIDGRADLFAVGVILYWMATGDKPFAGDSLIAVQYKVVHSDPIPPRKLNPSISRELEAVILKGIAKDPAERYQSGEDFVADLRALRSSQTITTRTLFTGASDTAPVIADSDPTANTMTPARTPTAVQPKQGVFRRGVVLGVIATAAVVLGAGGVVMKMREKPVPAVQPALPVAATPPAAAPVVTPPTTTPSAPAAPVAMPKAVTKAPTAVPPRKAAETITLELTASDRSNAVFSAAGQPMETLMMKPGDSVTLKADKEATLSVTNAPALQAKLNGKSVALPTTRKAALFEVTPEGLTESNNLGNLFPPGGSDGNQNGLASPARQKELAQSPTSGRLLIKSTGIAEFLTLVVRVDDNFFFRKEATALPPEAKPGAVQAAPLAEEKLLPPGPHKIQVTVLLGTTRIGQAQELNAQFGPGERHTLNIQFVRDPQRRGGPRGAGAFTATLDN